MLEQSQTSFTMYGCRVAISQGLDHIERHVDTIESAVQENPGLAFDLAKNLVESACRTILSERDVSYSPSDDMPALFRQVSNVLPMLPPQISQRSDIRGYIQRTLGSLQSVIQGVTELRNNLGTVSHGTDSPRPEMEAVHAILVAQAADTIVGFLYCIHAQGRNSESQDIKDSDFDNFIDELYGNITIFESEFSASEILYGLEPTTYRVSLVDFQREGEYPEEETS